MPAAAANHPGEGSPGNSGVKRVIEQLQRELRSRCLLDDEERRRRAIDVSHHRPQAPDAVVLVETVGEVEWVSKLCHQHEVPLIPFGTATAVEGGVVAIHGGVALDTSRLNRVLAVHPVDQVAIVQSGVTRLQLNRLLSEREGVPLYFPVDPGADASLGGMAATCAAGSGAYRYGTMRQRVMGLEVVLADGRRIRLGGRYRKSSAGYDLTRLFVGSEGTLGTITELTLGLERQPDAMAAATCGFPDLSRAIDSVIAVREAGIPMARIELLDEVQMEASIRYSGLTDEPSPTLFFEFHGSRTAVEEQSRATGEVLKRHGAGEFRWAVDEDDRKRLWQARYDCFYAGLALRDGSTAYTTDVCVPLSELAGCMMRTSSLVRQMPFPSPMLGHVGDGNFHVLFVIDPEDEEELQQAREAGRRIVEDALAVGGTCTGEHGIGLGKITALQSELGPAMEVMRQIKTALDPRGIMNPGKVLPNATDQKIG